MLEENWQGRQGDLLFIKIRAKVDEVDQVGYSRPRFKADEPNADNEFILAEGEKTGHKHRLSAESAKVDLRPGSPSTVVIEKESQVIHDEHPPLTLERGVYTMIRQREFDYEEYEENKRRRSAVRPRFD